MTTVLTLLMVSCLPAAEPSKDEQIEKDRKQLEGSWIVVTATVPGAPQSVVDDMKSTKYAFQGSKVVLSGKTGTGEIAKFDAAYELDPTKSPREITIFAGGDDRKRESPGLYEISGDELKLCLAIGTRVGGKDVISRPKGFDSKDAALLVLKREKP